MKYRIKLRRTQDVVHEGRVVKEAGEEWWETLDRDTDDPEADAQAIVDRFNNTLREGESPRELLEVEVLGEPSEKHHWERLSARGADGEELGKCKNCGIMAELKPNFSSGGYKGTRLPPWDDFRFRSCVLVRKVKRADENPCSTCGEPEGKPCRLDTDDPDKGPVRDWPHKARVDSVEVEP